MTMIGLVFGSEFWNIINFKIHHLRSYTGKSKNTKRTRMLYLGFGNHLCARLCPKLWQNTICGDELTSIQIIQGKANIFFQPLFIGCTRVYF